MLNIILMAALSVTPVYTNHNRIAGNVQTMTNMQAWAQAVETALAQGGGVVSVNEKTGAVVLSASDVGSFPTNNPNDSWETFGWRGNVLGMYESFIGYGIGFGVDSAGPYIAEINEAGQVSGSKINVSKIANADNIQTQIDSTMAGSNLCTVAAAQAMSDSKLGKQYGEDPTDGKLTWEKNLLKLSGAGVKADSVTSTGYFFASIESDYTWTGGNLSQKADKATTYTKAEVDGNTVTNGGAVAAAIAQADTKYLPASFVNDSYWEVSANNVRFTGEYLALLNYSYVSLAGWDRLKLFGGYQQTLPSYLASGTWNTETGTNKFAKIGDIPAPVTDAHIGTIATNSSEAVVGDVMEYGLTNLEENTETFSLASGFIGNLHLDSSHTNINLTLLYPSSNSKSFDIILRVINAADAALSINNEYTDVDGADWTKVKAGTNYVSVTRTAYEGDRSKVLVNVKGL